MQIKNKQSKNILAIIIISFFCFLVVETIQITFASNPLTHEGSRSGQELFCRRGFGDFLTVGLDFDGEGFMAYWNDILVIYNKNYCHYADIDSLHRRISSLRKQLRQAFYVCDIRTIERLSALYKDLSAELFYARNFVITASGSDKISKKDVKNDLITLRNNFREEFIQKFSGKKRYYSREEAIKKYTFFENKYKSKLKSYQDCSGSDLEALKLKVKELLGTFEAVKEIANNFKSRTAQRAQQTQARIEKTPGLGTVFSSKNVGDAFGRIVEVNINNQKSSTFFERLVAGDDEIMAVFRENTPGMSEGAGNQQGMISVQKPGIYLGDITRDLNEINFRDNYLKMESNYLAGFDTKYRQSEDLGLFDMLMLNGQLLDILQETRQEFDAISLCTAKIVGKQCSQ